MPARRITLMFLLSILTVPVIADEDSAKDREQKFSERMSGTVLVGAFTVDGQESGAVPKEERYEINSVVKSSDNIWIFTARVKYNAIDVTLPIPVPVVWAGDTPVVSLTDAHLPGLGEGFSCRVIFHGDRYAGTWQHGEHGGHMFGRIEKQQKPAAAAKDDADASVED